VEQAAQRAGCAVSVPWGFEGPTSQALRNLVWPQVDPMPCIWDWTGDLWRYLPTWMTRWFSWCSNRENWVTSISGMPESYLQLGTKGKRSAFRVAWTFSEGLILKNVLCSILNASPHAVILSPQHFTNSQCHTGI